MPGKSKRAAKTPYQPQTMTYLDSSGRQLNSRDRKTLLKGCSALARQLFVDARKISQHEIEARLNNWPLNERGVPEGWFYMACKDELEKRFLKLTVAEQASVASGHNGKLVFETDRSSTLEKDGVAWGWRIGRAPDGSLSMMPEHQRHLTNVEMAGMIKRVAMLKR